MENIIGKNNISKKSHFGFTQFYDDTIITPWRSVRVSLNRSEESSKITVTGVNYGGNFIDVCIFERENNGLIGYTKTIEPYASSYELTWTNSDLVINAKEIDVFFTMYREAKNNLKVNIKY